MPTLLENSAPPVVDYILNGQASGGVASTLIQNGGDPRSLRPFIGRDGRTWLSVADGIDDKGKVKLKNVLARNANGTLKYDEWKLIDQIVTKAAKAPLRVVGDVRSAGLNYNLPNGMAHTFLQYQNLSNITPATVSMTPARRSDFDRPVFDINGIPLPVVHKDFMLDTRQLLASKQGNMPLDTTMIEASAREVAEVTEKLFLGTYGTYAFGGGTLYGLTNFPSRLTKTMTAPTGTNESVTLTEVLDMVQKSQDALHYGPWVLYVSPNWGKYLDDDYILTGGNVATMTLRERLAKIDGISAVRTAYFLTGYTMVLVQMTSDVIQAVNGMEIQTVQWEEKGGFEVHFKVIGMTLPRVRADFNGNAGIVHGSV